MKSHGSILLAILLLTLAGCSNTRFLAEDQLLYTGRLKVEINKKEEDIKNASVKPYIKPATAQKPNNSILEKRILPPIGLWVYNYWKVDKDKKFQNWLYKTLSAPPVLISDVDPELRARKIESDLFDQGFFEVRAWSVVDTSARNPKKASVSYFIEVFPPYTYNEIGFDTLSEPIDTLIRQSGFKDQVKAGDQFNLTKLKSAKLGVAQQIQNLGYFYFNPEFIELVADTALGKRQLNLEVSRVPELPESVLSRYNINSIFVNISRASDTAQSLIDTVWYDDLVICSTNDYVKHWIIRDAVMIKKGDQYSYDANRSTIRRLNSLGIFSYVRVTYEMGSREDSLLGFLDVRVDLMMADNISLDLGADLVMKSTGYQGPMVSASVSNSNSFNGAEKIHLGLKGGFEWQWKTNPEANIGTFSYEVGANAGLTFPRMILPGEKARFNRLLNQQTSINTGVSILTRTAYYSMFSFMVNYNYTWAKTQAISHTFSPVYLNSVNLLATTPVFDSIVDANIYIRRSFEEQFIIGMKYNFIYDNTYKKQFQNLYFMGGISTSGNLLDLLYTAAKDDTGEPNKIFGNPYSQYVKLTTDFRYYLNGYNKKLVFRLYAGLGLPYNNSTVIPYVEQFFSGGAHSIRAFIARTLGPGSFYDAENDYIDQSGDLKLEGNIEFRFDITKILKGAVFLETGNIWLVNEDQERPGSKFEFNTFYNQLAVGTGVGVRFDFNFFVLRTDFGLPIRTPYLVDGNYWHLGSNKIMSGWIFNLSIGYPF